MTPEELLDLMATASAVRHLREQAEKAVDVLEIALARPIHAWDDSGSVDIPRPKAVQE